MRGGMGDDDNDDDRDNDNDNDNDNDSPVSSARCSSSNSIPTSSHVPASSAAIAR